MSFPAETAQHITDLPLCAIARIGGNLRQVLHVVGYGYGYGYDYDAFAIRLADCSVSTVDEAVIAMAIADARIEFEYLEITGTPAALAYLEIDLDETYPPSHWVWKVWRHCAPPSKIAH